MLPSLLLTLAQIDPIAPFDDLPAKPPAAPAQRPMTFRDFQNGISDWNNGQTDNTVRNGLLIIVGLVILTLIVLHLRQRWRARQSPDSERRLARELGRLVPFPFAARFFLRWVARSAGVHVATLLLSSEAFSASVEKWAGQPTFVLIRRWGRSRLALLQPRLFNQAS